MVKTTNSANKIDKKAIESYLFPELEAIKSLLEGLNLQGSLAALIFLQKILRNELKNLR